MNDILLNACVYLVLMLPSLVAMFFLGYLFGYERAEKDLKEQDK